MAAIVETLSPCSGLIGTDTISVTGCEATPKNMRYLDVEVLNNKHRIANQAFYDQTAWVYANLRAWSERNQVLVASGLHVRIRPYLETNDRVIVVGAGTGSDLALLRKLDNLNLNCIGIDLSHGMLKQAAHRINDGLIQAEANAIPLTDGSADFIYCEAAAEHFDSDYLTQVLREFRRLLKKGDDRKANVLLGVRCGTGKVARVVDMGKSRYFATYTQEELGNIFKDAGVECVVNWKSHGGTPSVTEALPWLDSVLKI